jgi:hypothetical protein
MIPATSIWEHGKIQINEDLIGDSTASSIQGLRRGLAIGGLNPD